MWKYVLLGLVILGAAHNNNEETTGCLDNGTLQISDTPEELLKAKLDALIGLKNVKKQVNDLVNFVKVQKLKKERNLPCFPISLHMVFSGNPGTGKTIVARILSQYFYRIGLCKKQVFIEVDRACIVQKYIGHTEARVKELFDKARGGVLFIDEAYALVTDSDKDFGQRAIDTIVKLLEDDKDETIVIVAGYPDKMTAFLDSNPGLKSRFPFRIAFEDYDEKELYQIFCHMANEYNLRASKQCEKLFYDLLKKHDVCAEAFGNARGVRNIFEKAVLIQANRVAGMTSPTNEDLINITPDDLKCLLDIPVQAKIERKIGFEANMQLINNTAQKSASRTRKKRVETKCS